MEEAYTDEEDDGLGLGRGTRLGAQDEVASDFSALELKPDHINRCVLPSLQTTHVTIMTGRCMSVLTGASTSRPFPLCTSRYTLSALCMSYTLHYCMPPVHAVHLNAHDQPLFSGV